MDAEIYKKGEVSVNIVAGDLILVYEGKGGKVEAKVETDYFMDLLAEKIPGEVDDAVINLLKAALKG